MDISFVNKNINNSEIIPFSDAQNINAESLATEKHVLVNHPDDLDIVVLRVVNKSSSFKEKVPIMEKKSKIKKSKIKPNIGERKKRKRKLSGNVDGLKQIKKNKKDDNFLGANKSKTNKFCDLTNENKDPDCSQTDNRVMPLIVTPDSQVDKDEIMEISSKKNLKTVSARKYNAIINACKKSLNVLSNFDFDILLAMNNSLRILSEHNFLENKLISIPTLIELIRLALETKKDSKEDIVKQEVNFSKIILNVANETNIKNPKAKRNIFNSLNNSSTESIQEIDQINSVFKIEGFATKELFNTQEKESEKIRENEGLSNYKTDIESQDIKLSDNQCNDKCRRNFITNYFKKLQKSSDEKNKKEKFGFSSGKIDISINPKLKYFTGDRRKKLEEYLVNQNYESNYLNEKKFVSSLRGTENFEVKSKLRNLLLNGCQGVENDSNAIARKKTMLWKDDWFGKENLNLTNKMKAKLLQFHDNRRPPYWGTWRRKSNEIKPKYPFGKDKMLNYDVDSDEEWEGEEEPGESLRGSDDEKEPEDDYELDNEFFVPHGYLSDDENPEKEKMPLSLLEEQFSSELNQKSKKMTPIVFGSYWLHNVSPQEECVFEDLNLGRLKYVPWSSLPIQIKENDEKQKLENNSVLDCANQMKKFKTKVTFPANEVPNLIKIIHGSPQNGDQLARKFLNQWQSLQSNLESERRSILTKKCVLKKIKELASWQISQDRRKMCWLVSKETQKEFGTEIESETIQKNPQKCYIWKFIKKGDKTTGKPTQVP